MYVYATNGTPDHSVSLPLNKPRTPAMPNFHVENDLGQAFVPDLYPEWPQFTSFMSEAKRSLAISVFSDEIAASRLHKSLVDL